VVLQVAVEALVEVGRQEEIVGATEETDRVGVVMEIAIEVMTIVISIEKEEIADSGAVVVVVAVAVVYVMLGRKVTAQEAHHAGFPMMREATLVAAVVVVECAMTIKKGDVFEVTLVDSRMKKVVVTVVDEVVMADVEMEEGETEVEMVVGIEMEDHVNRSVVMIN